MDEKRTALFGSIAVTVVLRKHIDTNVYRMVRIVIVHSFVVEKLVLLMWGGDDVFSLCDPLPPYLTATR